MSTDYDGTGNPESATWTSLNLENEGTPNADEWVNRVFDLSGFASETEAYIAFHYTSSGTASGTTRRWRVDEIVFKSTPDESLETIHYWSFNNGEDSEVDGTNQPIPADIGNGDLTHTFANINNFTGSSINAEDGFESGQSFVPTSNSNNGKTFQLNISTVGYFNIVLSFAAQRTNEGFDDVMIEVSANNGAEYETVISNLELPTSFAPFEYNLSNVLSDVEDNEDVIVRFTLNGASSGAGNNRYDNMKIEGTEIPSFSVEIDGANTGDFTGQDGEGWRFMSTPVEGSTFNNLFDGTLWLQGPGYPSNPDADSEDANLRRLSATGDYEYITVDDLENPVGAGTGFIIYVYSDDNFNGTPTGFPKTVEVTGFEHSGTIELDNSFLNEGTDVFSIAGNPFASTIAFSGLSRTNIGEVVYVYSHAFEADPFVEPDESGEAAGGGFRAWNGLAGSLSGGLIAPFQGFLVSHTGTGSPSLEIPESAKVSGDATFYDVDETKSLQIAGRINQSQMSDVWLSFSEEGSLNRNAFDAEMIFPMDYRAFLTMYFEADETAFDIKNLPDEIAEPVHLPLHIYGWKPNGSSSAPGFIPMSGSVEFVWPEMNNIPSNWSVTLTDNVTGEVIDLRESDGYEFELDASKNDKTLEYKMAIRSPKVTDKAPARFTVTVQEETSTSTPAEGDLPREIALNQNYPNPFNPATQISYDLPESADVRLEVYNVQGQRVATLINSTQNAGTHSVTFDASRLASGVYLYRLQAGNTVMTRKMMLVK